MILILGGTGAYFLDLHEIFGACDRRVIDTPYGEAGVILLPERFNGAIGFTSRHGLARLEVTPPFVNARANIWAAHKMSATHMLSWNGVGAIAKVPAAWAVSLVMCASILFRHSGIRRQARARNPFVVVAWIPGSCFACPGMTFT